ncbi:hypothetical protein ACWGDX_30485 [Streptomyces sp. NPDC055025]
MPPGPGQPLITPLIPAERRVLVRLAEGDSLSEAADALKISLETARERRRRSVAKLQAHGRAVLHTACLARELPLPDETEAPAGITEEDRRLRTAVTTTATNREAGAVLLMSSQTTRTRIRALRERTGARNDWHLIQLGHRYRLFDGPSGRAPIAQEDPAALRTAHET